MFFLVLFTETKNSSVTNELSIVEKKLQVDDIVHVQYPHGLFEAKVIRKASKCKNS